MHVHEQAVTAADPFSFVLILTTGLLAGLSHCVGMCGPLVSAFVLQRRQQRAEVSSALLTFQLGRLTTYGLLGLLAGALGSAVQLATLTQGWQGGISIALGLIMLLAGVHWLGWWPLPGLRPPRWLQRSQGWLRYALRSQHPVAPFALGVSNGLLPCAAIYTMLLLAAATGKPVQGALAMFVFGLGTLPALVGVGLFAARVSLGWRGQLYRVAAVLVLLVGVQLVLRGLAVGQHVAHFSVAGVMLW